MPWHWTARKLHTSVMQSASDEEEYQSQNRVKFYRRVFQKPAMTGVNADKGSDCSPYDDDGTVERCFFSTAETQNLRGTTSRGPLEKSL
jgi:hypothetical protein